MKPRPKQPRSVLVAFVFFGVVLCAYAFLRVKNSRFDRSGDSSVQSTIYVRKIYGILSDPVGNNKYKSIIYITLQSHHAVPQVKPDDGLWKVHDVLTVYDSIQLNMERIGKDYDGGYNIALLGSGAYDLYLGGGINDDTSFENHFFEIHSECKKGFAFDASIEKTPPLPSSVTWKQEFIGFGTDNNNDLTSFMSMHKDIFLKIDIEGGEWDWFTRIDKTLLRNVKQMTMELHTVCGDSYDDSSGIDYHLNVLKKLGTTHDLIWAHGNNYRGVCSLHGLAVPVVLELTYIRKGELDPLLVRRNSRKLPRNDDMPNSPDIVDIPLNYPPFRIFNRS